MARSVKKNTKLSRDPKAGDGKKTWGNLNAWVSPVLLVCALFLIFIHQVKWGEFFGVLALIFQFGKVYREQMPSWIEGIWKPFSRFNPVWLLCLLWLVFCAVTLSFPNFNWLFPPAEHFPFRQSLWASFFLFLGLAFAFRIIPQDKEDGDLSPWAVRLGLLACLGLGAYLRMYHSSIFVGTYWDDTAFGIAQARRVADLADYKNAFSFAQGMEPVWPFTAVFFWKLFPDASSLFIQRLTSTVFDLAAIWVLYLAGKELAGRRMGLLAAALGAISKPMIAKCITGYGSVTVPLGMALAILFTLRLIKKPSIGRFLQWGAAVAFGVYTSPPFQPFVPFFVFIVLVWLWLQRGERRPDIFFWVNAGVLLVYFLYCNNAFSSGHWISRTLDFWGPLLVCGVLGCILVWAVYHYPKMAQDRKNESWTGWIVGAWLCALLSFPVLTNENLFGRVRDTLITTGAGGFLTGSYILTSFQRVAPSVLALFWQGNDRNDMQQPIDAFFGYTEVVLIALGLAFCLARMNQVRAFLLLTALIGFAPYAASAGPHSGRLVGCTAPFLLLAALGLNELLKALSRVSKKRILYRLAWVLLLALWGWTAQGSLLRVYDQWSEKLFGPNALLHLEAAQDLKQGIRVYLDPASLNGLGSAVLFEREPVQVWRASNIVYLGPEEKPGDVAIYMNPQSNLKGQLEKLFPTAQWKTIKCPAPYDSVTVLRCYLPLPLFSAKSKSPRPMEFRSIQPPYWQRQYSTTLNGLAFGVIEGEDKTVNMADPVPGGANPDGAGARYRGVIHVDQSGKFEITCKTGNRADVRIDGRKIFNLYFPQTAHHTPPAQMKKKNVYLEAGDHRVEVKTWFQRGYAPPEITLKAKGTAGEAKSLWTSFRY
jgi:hypothetical protein